MTQKETALCHLAVLTHMLGQITQIKAQMTQERPQGMSLTAYQKAMSDVGAQHEALSFSVSELTRIYGAVPVIIDAKVTGGEPTGIAETPHELGG